ncbi:MAG: 5-formyltetrahydrofolate cyclo-ligase [Psychrosphaera sp.]|nr:5-formyltetrahydrofolate cyclo-ligase [Psychrosphaera sp.]
MPTSSNPIHSKAPPTKTKIRRHIRQLRKQLSKQHQQNGGEQLAKHLLERVQQHRLEPEQQHQCKRVALFLSMDGEIDTQPAIEQLWQASVEVYIPLIHPFNPQHLIFIRYQPDTPLVRSKLGMLEPLPDCSQVCPLAQLDIIFTPLVAFDSSGNRLGMGGGFYDRTLAYHYKQQRPSPAIIGIAHDCQKVDEVPTEPWDIPLRAIITPSCHYCV